MAKTVPMGREVAPLRRFASTRGRSYDGGRTQNISGVSAMLGLMQDWPLLVHKIIDHAANYHADREIVTRTVEGPFHRTTYREIRARAKKVSRALEKKGLRP